MLGYGEVIDEVSQHDDHTHGPHEQIHVLFIFDQAGHLAHQLRPLQYFHEVIFLPLQEVKGLLLECHQALNLLLVTDTLGLRDEPFLHAVGDFVAEGDDWEVELD